MILLPALILFTACIASPATSFSQKLNSSTSLQPSVAIAECTRTIHASQEKIEMEPFSVRLSPHSDFVELGVFESGMFQGGLMELFGTWISLTFARRDDGNLGVTSLTLRFDEGDGSRPVISIQNFIGMSGKPVPIVRGGKLEVIASGEPGWFECTFSFK